MSNIIGNRFSRIDERHIPIDHFAVFHTRRSNLSKLIMIKGETRGFGVDHHNVLVKSTKIHFFCQIRYAAITLAHSLRSSVADICIEIAIHKTSLVIPLNCFT